VFIAAKGQILNIAGLLVLGRCRKWKPEFRERV